MGCHIWWQLGRGRKKFKGRQAHSPNRGKSSDLLWPPSDRVGWDPFPYMWGMWLLLPACLHSLLTKVLDVKEIFIRKVRDGAAAPWLSKDLNPQYVSALPPGLLNMFGCFSLFLRGRTKGKRWTRVLEKSTYAACFPFGCATAKHIFKALKHFGFKKCFRFKVFDSCLVLTLRRLSLAGILPSGTP